MNITIPTSYEVTKQCFDWCKEQSFIYQQNLSIYEMSFIVIALIALAVHHLIGNYSDFFNSQDFDDELLEKVYDGSLLLAFIMLILFVIYMMWLR